MIKQRQDFPEAGDAVLLTDVWPWAGNMIKPGSYGIIGGLQGIRKDRLCVTWNYSAFRGYGMSGCPEHDYRVAERLDKTVSVSCSGGPATIALPSGLLERTDEVTEVIFWAWKSFPRGDGGFNYKLDVPVWTWDGKGY